MDSPRIANLDDIDKAFAARAFDGTSFSPEKRGESRRQEYADHVNGLYSELWLIAKTDEQKAILAEEMERYRQGYLKHMRIYLAAHSGIVSTMIAGPSGFPAARMQKRNDSLHRRVSEFLGWSDRAQKAIKAKILNARPEEEKTDAEWKGLARDIAGSLGVIKGIDEGTAKFYTRSSFVNSIAGKVERLAKNGEVDMVARALEFVRKYNESNLKPAIGSKHKFWAFSELAEQNAARHEEASQGEAEVIARAEGVEIIADPSLDRVQIVFDSKPDSDMLAKLRGEGWRWAPSQGAWQRKLTSAAKNSAIQITGDRERR